jgi:nucleoside-diphosphate-sugar epimerase
MKILVTGAAGFIGSHLVEQLLDEGHDVVGVDAFIDYYPRGVKERNLLAAAAHPNYRFVEADLRDAELDPLVEGMDAIINEAAMAGLVRSWDDLALYASCNVLALGRLIDAALRHRVARFVQISTSSVYGTNAVGDETQPTQPSSPYGVTKLAAEHLIGAHRQVHGLPAIILRYFSIYGPRQRPDMAYHIFTEAMLHGRPITLFGDGGQTRSNTFVTDAVRGTIRALEGGTPGEVYNIGGGEVISLRDAVEIIAAEVGVEPVIERQEPRPGDQRHTAADTSRAAAVFGYQPSVGAREGLRRQVAWHRELQRSGRGGADAA